MSTIICIDDGKQTVNIYVPCVAKQYVGETYDKIMRRRNNIWLIASLFVQEMKHSYIIDPDECVGVDRNWEYHFGFNIAIDKVVVYNNKIGRNIFIGSGSDFVEWSVNMFGVCDLLNKVVQFQYAGGTKAYTTRTVRIENIVFKNGIKYIHGIDLSEPDLSKAHRQYCETKILGEIKVIN